MRLQSRLDGVEGGGPLPQEPWEFAGWGTAMHLTELKPIPAADNAPKPAHLGVWASTAICGNDITSSCLYVSALCAAQAGRYAPLVLVLVAAVLYLYRSVYAEVGSAIPLNGGTYTVLLNTTNKRIAAMAAVLTLLSYVATAVISASEAMHYAHNLWSGLHVFGATIALLGLFAVLNVVGISESAVVAIVIFVFHLVTLSVLSVLGAVAISTDPAMLIENLSAPGRHSLGEALFFGFAAAMLGISGFESSANFIEEQKPGVFPKTLRNMWIAVAVFNPTISLLSLGLLPLAEIEQVPPDLLAEMGTRSTGAWLGTWVSVDAVLVLSGAVLTSYVGVTGLVRRMTLDRCLPQVLLAQNRWRGTNHWIILGFLFVCCSILAVTSGNVGTLAGVYTISFLAVMALYAIGNIQLKLTRNRLPRATRASWPTVVLALVAVLVGLAGNLVLDPKSVAVFAPYFFLSASVVGIMLNRVLLLRIALFVARSVADVATRLNDGFRGRVSSVIEGINAQSVIYFTKTADPAELNRAALYVLQNEQTTRMTVLHVQRPGEEVPPALAEHLTTIDHLYPQLRIDLVVVDGTFGPELIDALSRHLGVPRNYMFIGTPGDRFPHQLESLGGVRLIV